MDSSTPSEDIIAALQHTLENHLKQVRNGQANRSIEAAVGLIPRLATLWNADQPEIRLQHSEVSIRPWPDTEIKIAAKPDGTYLLEGPGREPQEFTEPKDLPHVRHPAPRPLFQVRPHGKYDGTIDEIVAKPAKVSIHMRMNRRAFTITVNGEEFRLEATGRNPDGTRPTVQLTEASRNGGPRVITDMSLDAAYLHIEQLGPGIYWAGIDEESYDFTIRENPSETSSEPGEQPGTGLSLYRHMNPEAPGTMPAG